MLACIDGWNPDLSYKVFAARYKVFARTVKKTSELDKYKEGDKVQVNINIRGREWQSPQGEVKYFNSIQGWRISAMEAAGGAAEMPPMDTATADDAMGEDDLPF